MLLWKAVEGYVGSYEVSSHGTVRGLDRTGHDGRKLKGKVIKGRPDKDGYLCVVLRSDGESHQFKVHRLVCVAFHGKSELEVNHKDQIKSNNREDNLEWVTSEENSIHALAKVCKVKCPNGKIYTLSKGIAHFCREHNLTKQLLGKVILRTRKHHKGWTVA